mmetsp:Transcript_2260/g.6857  ORF Transcript_2260/g.6857 Transcript_2260/m.6857 type:complete len:206 (-) Transcript_2260:151-768(-)
MRAALADTMSLFIRGRARASCDPVIRFFAKRCSYWDAPWKRRRKSLCAEFHAPDTAASSRFFSAVVTMAPVVCSSSSMKLSTPFKIVATDHAGHHDSGWKSDMERHSLRSVSNRPFGVSMEMAGGLKGYSLGNLSLPMNSPPSYGVPGGPWMVNRQSRTSDSSGCALMNSGGSWRGQTPVPCAHRVGEHGEEGSRTGAMRDIQHG